MSTLEFGAVRKDFDGTEVLKGIDMAVGSGEFVVLLGASGCGKSTLLNLVSGLDEPSSGTIDLDGVRLNGVHPKRRDIAMVFQSYALYPNLSVARNIGFGLEMRGIARARREAAVHEAAAMLKIDHLLDRRPADLSGGQRQRVAIGRAIVRQPKLFLFDEPLSNLDAKLRAEMRGEIKRLHQSLGTTVLYVTHDQIEAMTMATRIAVMRQGQIEQIGPPEEIYDRPATLYVAEFVGAPQMNLFAGRLEEGRPRAGATGPGREVTLGVRPEAVGIGPAGGGIALEGAVDLVELTGPEKIVSFETGAGRIVAALPPSTRLDTGARVPLRIDTARLHVFDAATGRRCEPALA